MSNYFEEHWIKLLKIWEPRKCLRIVGMKHVGWWDGEDEICLSYGYDHRDFTSCMFGTKVILNQTIIATHLALLYC